MPQQFKGNSFSDQNEGLAIRFGQRYDQLKIAEAQKQDKQRQDQRFRTLEDQARKQAEMDPVTGGYGQDLLNAQIEELQAEVNEQLNQNTDLSKVQASLRKRALQIKTDHATNVQQTAYANELMQDAKQNELVDESKVDEYRQSVLYQQDQEGQTITQNGKRELTPIDSWDFPKSPEELYFAPNGSRFANWNKVSNNFFEAFRSGSTTLKSSSEQPETAYRELQKVSAIRFFSPDRNGNFTLSREELTNLQNTEKGKQLHDFFRRITGEEKPLIEFVKDDLHKAAKEDPWLDRGMKDAVIEATKKNGSNLNQDQIEAVEKNWLLHTLENQATGDFSFSTDYEKKDPKDHSEGGGSVFMNAAGGFGGINTKKGRLYVEEMTTQEIASTYGPVGENGEGAGASPENTFAISLSLAGETGIELPARTSDSRDGKVAEDFRLTDLRYDRNGNFYYRGVYATDEGMNLRGEGNVKKAGQRTGWISMTEDEESLFTTRTEGISPIVLMSLTDGFFEKFPELQSRYGKKSKQIRSVITEDDPTPETTETDILDLTGI
ncbi:MAG TPA: hypothetical protein DDW81_01555 [Cryomorphaceae bacterium]|nr:hypothetical protein [Owenweeksia sp.]HBF18749.1 hypothetical protein [Cryomorphaceae bacterium]|tara:strand:- start:2493 stop:4142 length:1650 start_codon:yes stop_codon:yes gene_type:complete